MCQPILVGWVLASWVNLSQCSSDQWCSSPRGLVLNQWSRLPSKSEKVYKLHWRLLYGFRRVTHMVETIGWTKYWREQRIVAKRSNTTKHRLDWSRSTQILVFAGRKAQVAQWRSTCSWSFFHQEAFQTFLWTVDPTIYRNFWIGTHRFELVRLR